MPAGGRGGEGAEALEVHLEAAVVDVRARAVGTAVRPLPGVELVVELEVDELREAGRTQLALVGPLARVEPLVSLQVTGAAESFVANLRRS